MGNVAASLGRGGSNQILTIFTNNLKACSQDCVGPKRAATEPLQVYPKELPHPRRQVEVGDPAGHGRVRALQPGSDG
jgi:hypothetical protein